MPEKWTGDLVGKMHVNHVTLAELGKELADKNIRFSDQAAQELKICIDALMEILDLTQQAMETGDTDIAKKVEPLEEVIDVLTTKCKHRHVQRVQEGSCTLELGFVFNDCLNNIERAADHCSNIAVAVLEAENASVHAHGYLRSIKELNDRYDTLLAEYSEKYII